MCKYGAPANAADGIAGSDLRACIHLDGVPLRKQKVGIRSDRGRQMTDKSPRLREIEERLDIARDNLRQLNEQAAAYSGAEDEERAAQRITDQEDEIARLNEEYAKLTNGGGA
jgi:uncharacterized protein involved in exopolysaccharide biosynthesis